MTIKMATNPSKANKKSPLQIISALVLLAAVSIGVVGKTRPQLFLRVPNVGFVLWAVTGHHMPPYFDESCLFEDNFKRQVQDGDIVIASGAKAGTLWVQNTVFLLRSGGWDDVNSLWNEYYGICEWLMYPEHSIDLRLQQVQEKRQKNQDKGMNNMQHFTHMYPAPHLHGLDPAKNPKVKYLAIVRNGKEVVRSFYHFMNAHIAEFRTMWGGFPPKLNKPEDSLKLVVQDVPDLYFGHLLGWWKVKDLPNVHLIHYADLRTNPRKVIEGIAQFMDVDLKGDLLDVVVHKSSHAYMSDPERSQRYDGVFGRPNETPRPMIQQGAHINKDKGGRLDEGGDFFTEEMSEKWDAAMQKYFGHDWIRKPW